MDEKIIQEITEEFGEIMEEINNFYLEKLGKDIKSGMADPENVALINRLVEGGKSFKEIEDYLKSKQSEINRKIDDIFDDIAKEEYAQAKKFAEYKDMDFVAYSKNAALLKRIASVKKITQETFKNLSNTTLMGMYVQKSPGAAKVFMDMREAYIFAIDKAVLATTSGYANQYDTVRTTLKSIAHDGLYQVVYRNEGKKKYVQTIDVAVRRNVRDGISSLSQENQEQIGSQYGSDAIEISVHSFSAPDHIKLQGRVFSNKEWKRLKGKTGGGSVEDIYGKSYRVPDRGIGIWNCDHVGMAFMVGISERNYTDKQLDKINSLNEKGLVDKDGILSTQKGKSFTIYEATQQLRAKERYIRGKTYEQTLFRNVGDKVGAAKVAETIKERKAAYNKAIDFLKPYGVQFEANRFVTNK